jgi:hypothetical protein
MTIAQNELQTSSTGFRTAWTTTPVNYDIAANDPLRLNLPGLAIPGEGRPCRWIVCGSTGTIVVTGLDGVAVTLTAANAGQKFDIQAVNLVAAGTTVTQVSVFW